MKKKTDQQPSGTAKTFRIGKFNAVDVAAVVLIALVALFVVVRVAFPKNSETQRTVHMTYKVLVEGAARDMYDTVQEHLPSDLMASGVILDGQILSVEKRPYYAAGPDGVWMEDPNHVNLVFTVENVSQTGDVLMSKVGEQEIRIGRKDYTLKTEYIEFHNTIILDVDWEFITPEED